ncbi:Copper-transporting ATPase [Dirofilaria immitis]
MSEPAVPLVLSRITIATTYHSRVKLTCLTTSKPSSRSLLGGEQSNAWRILLRNDKKSRHRRIKKQRRYGRLAATSQLSLW